MDASAPSSSPSRAWVWAAAGVVLLGGILRVTWLAHESFWIDEAYMAAAHDRVLQPWVLFSVEWINDAPLYHFLVGFWSRIVQTFPGVEPGSVTLDFALRLLSASIGTASIAGVYWLVARLFDDRASALVAAFLFAISPFQIYYAQDLRPYALHVVLNIGTCVALVRALEANQPKDWVGFVVLCVLGIYNHFFMVFNIMAMNLYFVLFIRSNWKLLGRWIAANLAIIALACPGLAMMLRISGVFESASEDWYPVPGAKLLLITIKNFFAGYSPQAVWYRPLVALAGLLALGGIWRLRTTPRRLVLLVVMGIVPMALAAFYWRNANFPYYTHRLMIFSAVPIYALVALGIRQIPIRVARFAAIGALTALIVPALTDYYAQRVHPVVAHTIGWLYKADMRGAAAYVHERLEPADVVVHRLRYSQYPFRYYMGWDSPNFVGVPTQAAIDAQTQGYPDKQIYINNHHLPYLLDDLIADKKRVWYIDSWWRASEADGVARDTIERLRTRGVELDRRQFDAVTVYLFELHGETPVSDGGTGQPQEVFGDGSAGHPVE